MDNREFPTPEQKPTTVFATIPSKDIKNLLTGMIEQLANTVDEGHHIALVKVIQDAIEELANRGEGWRK